jgi:acyl-CoA thioesterase
MRSEFDTDTAVTAEGGGRYTASVTDRWDVGQVPNGGYVLSLAVVALAEELGQPDPLTVSGHFVRPAEHGAATVHVDVVRAGRRLATGQAALTQDGRERLRVLATFGDLGALAGPTHLAGGPPDLPPPQDCIAAGDAPFPGGPVPRVIQRVDQRFPPGTPGWAHGRPSGTAELAAWLRLADQRPLDTLVLPLLVDCFPPPVFELGVAGWVPTVELTCHVRARPAPGWLRCAVRTRYVQDGLLEEEIDVWDAADRLVAQARQLAMMPPSRDGASAPGQP